MSYYLWRQTKGVGDWRKACDAHLLPYLISGDTTNASKWLFLGLTIIWMTAAFAMAGPTWERIEQPLYHQLAPRVVVLDLSHSMDATDIKPSRLTHAKFKLADLLKTSTDGQHAIVVFAGDAFVIYPLTDDINPLLNLLPALNTEVVPVQGGRASHGLELAMGLLDNAGAFGDIVLITDGVDAEANDVAKSIKRGGHALYVLAVGTETGAPIQMTGGGFLKDAAGGIVLPVVNFSALETLATLGGGRAVALTNDQADIEALKTASMLRSLTRQTEEAEYLGDLWRDAGIWLVLLLLPLAALAFRRGWLWACAWMVLTIPVITPQPAQAAEWWDALWQRPDQRAAAAMQQKDFERAAALSDNPLQRGSALFRMDQFDTAANVFNEAINEAIEESGTPFAETHATAYYNRGNALAQQWQFDKALAAYKKVLELDPEFEDALHNREIVKQALEKLLQEQGEKGEPSEDGEQSEAGEYEAGEYSENNENKDNPGETDPEQNQQSAQDSQEQAERDIQQSVDQDENQDDMQESEDVQQTQPDENNTADQQEQEQEQTSESDLIALTERESQDAIEQWLRRIPDDPGGLLRRKFLLKHKQRDQAPSPSAQTW